MKEINTLKENSKSLNDKIQSFRENNLGVIRGLSNIHGLIELTTVKKALELANLYAWNAQCINETYHDIPRIEFPSSKEFAVKLNEVRFDEVKLAVCILEALEGLVVSMPEFFVMLENMDKDLSIHYLEYSTVDFEIKDTKIEATIKAMNRCLDNLRDAVNWSSLFLERKISLVK